MRELPTDLPSLPTWCIEAIGRAATTEERDAMSLLLAAESAVVAESAKLTAAKLERLERIQAICATVDPQPGESWEQVLDRLDGEQWLEVRELMNGGNP